jgi:uncharacterized membrane protein (GlpM family)
MLAESSFLLLLMIKMAITAGFVVLASLITERVGPVIGALVSTLPVAAGPGYVFLALDHDAAFLAQAAVASLAVNAATGIYGMVYVLLAQRFALWIALPAGFATWLLSAVLIRAFDWTLARALAANLLVYAIAVPLAARFRHVRMPPARRRWYDVPLRAAMVATLVATLVSASDRVGPTVSGVIATFPIVLTSLMLILQPRIGGPATAAVIANGMWGLVGFGLALLALHVTVVPLGRAAALSLALAVAVAWNFATWFVGWRRVRARLRAGSPSRPSS